MDPQNTVFPYSKLVKINGCPKNIDLRNIFRNFLWKKK